MTPIDMETYLDDNLAVYHAALGYRNQQEVCRNLERRRKARERAAAIRRQRRRQADHHQRIRNPVAILRPLFAKIRRFVLHSEIILSIVSFR